MPSKRIVRDGERFKCPYPGCKRSFAELWRLKVHYRAPPDVRGSGKERGHGQELSHCPHCSARLLPGKHHIQCSAARAKRAEAEKQAQAQAAAAAVGIPGAPGLRQVKLEHGQLQYQVGKGSNGMMYGSNQAPNTSSTNDLWSSNPGLPHAVQASTALGVPGGHVPPHQMRRLMAAEGNGWGRQGLLLSPGPSVSPHGHAHGHIVPFQMHSHHAYTNTIIREAVPGNPNAAHCCLQTDLCGATWPLNQPFPVPQPQQAVYHTQQGSYAMIAHGPGNWNGMGPSYGSGALPMGVQFVSAPPSESAPQTLTQTSANPSSAQTHCAMTVSMGGGDTSAAAPSGGAAPGGSGALGTAFPGDISGMHMVKAESTGGPDLMCNVKMERGGGTDCIAGLPVPPSPPSSPPPELVDMLFDFDKFDDLDNLESFDAAGAGAATCGGGGDSSGTTGFEDLDDVLGMGGADVTDTSELFKIFTPDVHGIPTMTTHLHQRMTSEQSAELPWPLDDMDAGGAAGSMASGMSADYGDGDGTSSAKRLRVDDSGAMLLSRVPASHMAG
eukprot:jgi/Ulvmu1/11223/UM072_0060.1